tara:strand:+ start:1304 stop:1486 length:183 start_codon:yes stop_codon:yes gene_type:complete
MPKLVVDNDIQIIIYAIHHIFLPTGNLTTTHLVYRDGSEEEGALKKIIRTRRANDCLNAQ